MMNFSRDDLPEKDTGVSSDKASLSIERVSGYYSSDGKRVAVRHAQEILAAAAADAARGIIATKGEIGDVLQDYMDKDETVTVSELKIVAKQLGSATRQTLSREQFLGTVQNLLPQQGSGISRATLVRLLSSYGEPMPVEAALKFLEGLEVREDEIDWPKLTDNLWRYFP